MEQWQTVYDFADRFPKFGVMAFVLMFVAVGWVVRSRSNPDTDDDLVHPLLDMTRRQSHKLFGTVYVTFAGLMALIVIPSTILDYVRTRSIYTHQTYQTVEGSVTDFDPMPVTGHRLETFKVAGIRFAFSDFDETDYGYNNTASHGGVIRQGLRVRIAYLPREEKNIILKLEIPISEPRRR
jgi:hypothetical protein